MFMSQITNYQITLYDNVKSDKMLVKLQQNIKEFNNISNKTMGGCFTKLKQKKLIGQAKTECPPPITAISLCRVSLTSDQQAFLKDSCPIQICSPIIKTLNQKVLPLMKYVSLQQFNKDQWKPIKCTDYEKGQLIGICKWQSEKQNYLNKQGLLYATNKTEKFLIGGMFISGKLDKKQKYFRIFQNGSYFIGQLNNSFQPDGEGQLYTSEGVAYIGYFNNGLPHGKGKKILNDRTFQGTFKKGEIVKGKQITEKGAYEGPFLNNKRHGKGVLQMNKGFVFKGQFKNNKKQGEGILWDAQGNIKQAGIWQADKFKLSKNIK